MLGPRHACVSDLTLVFSRDSGLQGPRHPSECIPFHSPPPFQLRCPPFSPRSTPGALPPYRLLAGCVLCPGCSGVADSSLTPSGHGSDPTLSMRTTSTTLCSHASQSPELSCPFSLLFLTSQCFSPLNIPLLFYYTVTDSVSELACELQQFGHLC